MEKSGRIPRQRMRYSLAGDSDLCVVESHPYTSHPPRSSMRGLQACTIADAASVCALREEMLSNFCNTHENVFSMSESCTRQSRGIKVRRARAFPPEWERGSLFPPSKNNIKYIYSYIRTLQTNAERENIRNIPSVSESQYLIVGSVAFQYVKA